MSITARSLGAKKAAVSHNIHAAISLHCILLFMLLPSSADVTTQKGILVLKANVLSKSSVGPKEPVIIRMVLINQTETQQIVSLGNDLESNFYCGVFSSDGRLVSPPQPKNRRTGLSAAIRLTPGESRTEYLSLSRWYQFQRVGRYSIRVQLLSSDFSHPIAEDKVAIDVVSFNKSRLEARCQQLLKWSLPGSHPIPTDVALKALFSVHDDVALPYFDYLAKEYSSIEACIAIRRVKTKRAEKLIKALATREDEVGKAARQALNLPLEETKPKQTTTID